MKGVSPIISYVLVITIVLLTTMAAYTWALPLSRELGEPGKVSNYRNQMIGLDYVIRSTAHGDYNFTTEYEMRVPEATLRIDPDKDSVYLSFVQKTGVIGRPNTTGTTTCNETTWFFYDNLTKVPMYRLNNYSRVFEGAAGYSQAVAEFALCYADIDLVWGGECIKGKPASEVVVRVKKIGFTDKPVVSIDLC